MTEKSRGAPRWALVARALLLATMIACSAVLVGCGADEGAPASAVSASMGPGEIVRAYLTAIKSGDEAAARKYVAEDHQAELDAQADGPFTRRWPLTDLRVGRPEPEKTVSSARRYEFVVRVPTQFRLPGGAVPTLGSGRVSWDFYLGRDRDTDPWRITEEGRG
jgi:hypothetical protein